MFSMKPKFDLAEFLAVPASTSGSKRRNAMRPGKPAPARADTGVQDGDDDGAATVAADVKKTGG
jgi:hypothetical protein